MSERTSYNNPGIHSGAGNPGTPGRGWAPLRGLGFGKFAADAFSSATRFPRPALKCRVIMGCPAGTIAGPPAMSNARMDTAF